MDMPEVRYVITDDDVRIAFHVFGDGPDTVLVPGMLTHLEGMWQHLLIKRLYERMAANLRVFVFDHRGSGMSDGFTEPPRLEDRVLDIKAVMDATGLETANMIAFDAGAQVAIGFAAWEPDRIQRMVLINARPGDSAWARAHELNPAGEDRNPAATVEAAIAGADTQGVEIAESFTYFNPSAKKHPDVLATLPSFDRLVGTRDAFRRQIESVAPLDVVDIAPLVRAPTLVSHASGNRVRHVGHARVLSELIPDSTLDEYSGEDHMFWLADDWRDIADSHIRFVTDSIVEVPAQRRFAVVLFTDIVASTHASVESGDEEWRRRLDTHDRISERVVTQHEGLIIKQTGDGVLAIFDTPSTAIDAASQLLDELKQSGISIRAGIHAGEVELRGTDIAGGVVNLAARVEQSATDGEIYTSKAIRDLLLGSDHQFEHAGSTELKGFDGTWDLYRVVTD